MRGGLFDREALQFDWNLTVQEDLEFPGCTAEAADDNQVFHIDNRSPNDSGKPVEASEIAFGRGPGRIVIPGDADQVRLIGARAGVDIELGIENGGERAGVDLNVESVAHDRIPHCLVARSGAAKWRRGWGRAGVVSQKAEGTQAAVQGDGVVTDIVWNLGMERARNRDQGQQNNDDSGNESGTSLHEFPHPRFNHVYPPDPSIQKNSKTNLIVNLFSNTIPQDYRRILTCMRRTARSRQSS